MKWDQRNPAGHGNHRGPRDGWMAQFLRAEAEKQAAMVTRVRERVERDLERTEELGTVPGEDTMRAARFALDGYRVLAGLELEHAKVRLLAERAGVRPPMTDEEFEAQLAAFKTKQLEAMSAEELEAELARKRALAAPHVRIDTESGS